MAIDFNSVGSSLPPRVRGSDQSAAKSSSATAEVTASPTTVADRVQLSAQAQSLFNNDALGSVDSGRVEALKKQIEDGSYQIDYSKLAGKLMGLESKV